MLGQHAGYQVEKGTSVNLDVVSIHHDATVFADPEKFNPDRFDVSSSLTASWGSAAGQGCALA